jgi:hypothetical protein
VILQRIKVLEDAVMKELLTQLILAFHASGVNDPLFTGLPTEYLQAGELILHRLGAQTLFMPGPDHCFYVFLS